MESERQTLAEVLSAAERRGGEEKLRFDDYQQQMKSAKAAAEAAKQELQDYKHKASRILQVNPFVILFLINSLSVLSVSKLPYHVPSVQRETNQQPKGGIWSGLTGWQWDDYDGARGSSA